MAITAALLTNGQDETDLTSYTTASISPGANRLICPYICVQRNADYDLDPTCIGNGITYTLIAGVSFDNASTRFMRLHLFRGMSGAPSSGTIVFDYGGAESFARAIWGVVEFNGVDTSGTNGSGAVGNTDTETTGSGGTVTSQSPTLASVGANNRPFNVCSHHANENSNHESGYTELHDDFIGTTQASSISLASEWHETVADTTPTFDWATAVGAASIAIEIIAAASAAPTIAQHQSIMSFLAARRW